MRHFKFNTTLQFPTLFYSVKAIIHMIRLRAFIMQLFIKSLNIFFNIKNCCHLATDEKEELNKGHSFSFLLLGKVPEEG